MGDDNTIILEVVDHGNTDLLVPDVVIFFVKEAIDYERDLFFAFEWEEVKTEDEVGDHVLFLELGELNFLGLTVCFACVGTGVIVGCFYIISILCAVFKIDIVRSLTLN